MATRIAVMHQGEVQQFAEPDTVYNRPANLFVARFMGAPPMNTLPARVMAEGGGMFAVLGGGDIRLALPVATDAVRRHVDRRWYSAYDLNVLPNLRVISKMAQ